MTKYEDRGNAPVVFAPFRIREPHKTILVGTQSITVNLPEDDCVNVILQSSGDFPIRITFDGSTPSTSTGFILTSNMPPTVFNLCGRTVIIKAVGTRNKGCVLECQIGE